MRKDTAGPSVKSNTEVEIEEKAKLTAKTSTASKDDKTEADQKPPSMAEPPSLRTKTVDKILAGRKSLDLSPENFPVLFKTEDNQIKEAHDTGENGRKNSKNMQNSIVEPRSHRGHILKEEDDKLKNSILPGSIPLQEMVASKSEEKEQLVKESHTPPKHDYKEDNNGEKPPFLPASLEWFHLGSFEAPLVRNVKNLSISEKTQQDPLGCPKKAKLTPMEKLSCLRQKRVTRSME